MKNSNYIADSVFNVNLKYVELQNQTKELFFRCLDEGRDIEYFKEQMRSIWGNIDYSFMNDEINEYEAYIHEINTHKIEQPKKGNDIFKLVPLSVIIGIEKMFVKQKEKEYKVSLNSYGYKIDKDDYLKMKVQRYTNQIVPYFSKSTGKKIRDVELSTYCSMIHNTNLTRAGWNQTLKDAEQINYNYFVIPYHPFSCEHCIDHQNRVMTRQQVINLIGVAEEKEGDILHPNCKCVLVAIKNYNDIDKIESPFRYSLTREEKINISNIRQKTNSLTLKKEKIKTDMKIQKSLGNQDEVDKLNQQRNKINKEIRELKEALPTTELKKQVVVINR